MYGDVYGNVPGCLRQCTGMFGDVPGCLGMYRNVWGCTGMFRNVSGRVASYGRNADEGAPAYGDVWTGTPMKVTRRMAMYRQAYGDLCAGVWRRMGGNTAEGLHPVGGCSGGSGWSTRTPERLRRPDRPAARAPERSNVRDRPPDEFPDDLPYDFARGGVWWFQQQTTRFEPQPPHQIS